MVSDCSASSGRRLPCSDNKQTDSQWRPGHGFTAQTFPDTYRDWFGLLPVGEQICGAVLHRAVLLHDLHLEVGDLLLNGRVFAFHDVTEGAPFPLDVIDVQPRGRELEALLLQQTLAVAEQLHGNRDFNNIFIHRIQSDLNMIGCTHIHLLLELLDLAFERLHVRNEGHSVRSAGRVHRMLLQFLTRLKDHRKVQTISLEHINMTFPVSESSAHTLEI